jgi:hypothetical protein
MSLVPTSTLYSSPGVPLWDGVGTNVLTAYNSSNLSWVSYSGTQGLSNAYIATISNSNTQGLLASSVVIANVRSGLSNDSANCWLIATVPNPNVVSFIVASNPVAPTNFTISWAVAAY